MHPTKLIAIILGSMALSSVITGVIIHKTSSCEELLNEYKRQEVQNAKKMKDFITPNFDLKKRYKGF